MGLLELALAGCNKASAASLDPSNPLTCAMSFQDYALRAGRTGNDTAARMLDARSQWFVGRAKSVLPADQFTNDALKDLGDRVAAAPNGGLDLIKDCTKRQNADPEFKRLSQHN